MTRRILFVTLLVAPCLVGCDGSNEGPPPPTLGEEVDRIGRPAINTALTDPFNLYGGGGQKDATQNGYNASADPAQWSAGFSSQLRYNLALFDGLDGQCGNQVAAPPGVDTPARYDTLTSLLSYDALYLDTSSGTCTTYLAVETRLLGSTNTDCGGRTPSYDVMDPTYSLLILGTPTGFTDTIDQDDTNPPGATFPFLGAPQ
ncbi:MAG TPA: hypothetical protein VH877_00710 [Polyangia bacterium]|nr:hypothetical protein [Polyangia bacterium]